MSEKTDFSTIQVPANATKEQLLAALDTANLKLKEADAACANLMRINRELGEQVNVLVDASDKTTSEHAGRGTHVRVSSAHKAGQHYRAGRLWTRDAIDVHKDDLTAEHLAALRADPMLVVVDL